MASGLESCRQNVTGLLTQRDAFQPKESTHHLHVIGNYVDHLHLDRTFLEGSRVWRSRQDPVRMDQFVTGKLLHLISRKRYVIYASHIVNQSGDE